MADSEAQICNLALGRIGDSSYIDTLDDATDEAEACKRLYPAARDEVLEDFDWPFARRRYLPAPLDATTLDSGAVPSGWTYAFALPADAIPNGIRKILGVLRQEREDEKIPFDIEYDNKTQQDILLTDEGTPEILYTARVTDTKKFAATFDSAVAWKLSPELVRALRKDLRAGLDLDTEYDKGLGKATAAAKRGVRQDPEPRPRHIAVRG